MTTMTRTEVWTVVVNIWLQCAVVIVAVEDSHIVCIAVIAENIVVVVVAVSTPRINWRWHLTSRKLLR